MPQELGTIAELDDGNELIMTRRGWVPNTPGLEATAGLGGIGQAAMQVADSASMGLLAAPEELPELAPGLSTGIDVAFLGAGGAGLVKGLGRGALRGTMANRVQQAGQQGLIPRPSNIAGRGTATGQVLRQAEAITDSIPGVNIPGIVQKSINQRRLNGSFARALNLSDDVVAGARHGITDDVYNAYQKTMRKEFKAVESGIGTLNSGKAVDLRALTDQAIDAGLVFGKNRKALESATQATGKEVMALRSSLNKVMRSNADYSVKEVAAELIEGIDDIIEATLSGDALKAFQATRSRYRLYSSAKAGRSIGRDGQVNPATMGGRLSNNYGDDYLSILSEGNSIKGATTEVDEFIKLNKLAESYDVGLPSSGTAERLGGALGAGALGGYVLGSD